jgi:uncharacterized membrane protein
VSDAHAAPRANALGRIWGVAALYAAVLFALGADRYATYRSGADLGLFVQSIASVFRGFSNTIEGGSHFTYHFSPILYLCAPFLLASHSALALTALQAVAGGLALPPVFLLARKRLPEALAFAVALVAALYPPLVGVIFTDFHENGFAPAATLWLIWAVDERRLGLAALFVALALSIKEDQAVVLGFAGLIAFFHFWRTGDRSRAAFAAASCVASAATFVAFFEIVRPLAGAKEAWGPTHFYTWTQAAVPRGTAPWYSVGRPAYFLEAVVPLAFACLVSPAFVFALPGFAEVLGSHESLTYTMGTHYAAVWVPWVLFAFVCGVARLYVRSRRLGTSVVRLSLALCALILAVASPTHWGHYLGPRTAHDAVLDRAVDDAGSSLDLGTFDEAYAHLGFDPKARLGLKDSPRYALADITYAHSWFTLRIRPLLQRGVARGAARLVRSEDGVELYEFLGIGSARALRGTQRDPRGGTAATGAEAAWDGGCRLAARTRSRERCAVDRSRRHE